MVVRVGAVQMSSQADVSANLAELSRLVAQLAADRADVVLLPENFAYLGPAEGRREHAEDLDRPVGPIVTTLGRLARRYGVWLVAGSLPERSGDPERPYSTCVVVAPDGGLTARYRKIHLFDAELGDGQEYRESRSTTAGTEPVVVALAGVRVGLSICYDLRFPELYRRLSRRGADVLMVPAAFTLATGKDHWTLLLRARAVENQAYVVAAAQWGRHGERVSWGKTCIVDPWGAVVAAASEGTGVVAANVDLTYLAAVRQRLPALAHRRLDV